MLAEYLIEEYIEDLPPNVKTESLRLGEMLLLL